MSADIHSLLLETLNAHAGGGTLPTTQELLTQLGERDPVMRLVTQLFAQNRREEGEHEAVSEDESEENLEPASEPVQGRMLSKERSQAVRRLRHKIESMHSELSELRQRNDALAAALGACHICWGNDPDCEVCDGRGGPGASRPDKQLFAQFVEPAARRLERRADNAFSKGADPSLPMGQLASVKGEKQ